MANYLFQNLLTSGPPKSVAWKAPSRKAELPAGIDYWCMVVCWRTTGAWLCADAFV